MLSFLREWVQEIVVLLILATVIDLALPNSSLKRYVDYTVGLILLLLLLTPVMRLLGSELDVSAMLATAEQRSGRTMVTSQTLSDNSSWLAYKLVLEERIKQLVKEIGEVQSVSAEVEVDKNSASITYGNPIAIVVHIKLSKGAAEAPGAEQIDEMLRTTYGLETAQIRIYIE